MLTVGGRVSDWLKDDARMGVDDHRRDDGGVWMYDGGVWMYVQYCRYFTVHRIHTHTHTHTHIYIYIGLYDQRVMEKQDRMMGMVRYVQYYMYVVQAYPIAASNQDTE